MLVQVLREFAVGKFFPTSRSSQESEGFFCSDELHTRVRAWKPLSPRKPCAKEVPETDYLTQREQYLNKTTLRRLKIPVRSIRSEECCTIALERSVSKKAVI